MLWMGGVGTTQPQVWVRGEPAAGLATRDVPTGGEIPRLPMDRVDTGN
ncbi:hypothetical protein H4687_007515 [Streptomyces stelliscabiei]|uniref:Uncharacterized protein n=1 Tax=Streptomyces stelliscabiei TaxID=146820 RepID=A0A8I0TVU6_9ACTN|nr:hypothetical protein [Streptomyces stelliscabiei]